MTTSPKKSLSPKLVTAVRILLGAIFVFSGVNGLLGLLPPPPLGARALLVWQGLAQTGYFFPLHRLVEIAAGLTLMLSRRYAPAALLALAPVIVNIAGFHLAVAPQGAPIVVVLVGGALALAVAYRDAFRPLLVARSPGAVGATRAVELGLGVAFVASAVAALAGKTPPPSTPTAAAMMEGLAASRYFMPLLIGTQLVAGSMLLARRYVPLALVALAPVVVQLVAYRFIAAGPTMMAVGIALLIAEAWLAWKHRAAFASLFDAVRSGTRVEGGEAGRQPAAAIPGNHPTPSPMSAH